MLLLKRCLSPIDCEPQRSKLILLHVDSPLVQTVQRPSSEQTLDSVEGEVRSVSRERPAGGHYPQAPHIEYELTVKCGLPVDSILSEASMFICGLIVLACNVNLFFFPLDTCPRLQPSEWSSGRNALC